MNEETPVCTPFSELDYEILGRAIQLLSEDEFRILRLRFIEHHTVEEVAELERLSWGEADKKIEACLERMRSLWAPPPVPSAAVMDGVTPRLCEVA